jgi:excisionase family DNA binding protein
MILLNRDQAAEYLNISVRKLLTMRRNREIPCVRISRNLVQFKKSDLDGYIEKHTIKAIV